jgi:hypothetical protein
MELTVSNVPTVKIPTTLPTRATNAQTNATGNTAKGGKTIKTAEMPEGI